MLKLDIIISKRTYKHIYRVQGPIYYIYDDPQDRLLAEAFDCS